MSGKENTQAYKDFKRRVILVALNEINKKSILHVDLYKEIKEGRRVSELVFFVTKQEDLEPSLPISNETIFNKMVDDFGITTNIARKIINQYDDEMILRNLNYTEQQYRKALKNKREEQFNLGAYATSAITKDYAPKPPKLLIKVIEEKEQKKEAELNVIAFNKKDRDNLVKKIMSLFNEIDKDLQDSLKKEFEKHGMRGPIKKIFEKYGWSNEKINNNFFIFITSQIEQGRKGKGYDQINILNNKSLDQLEIG